MKRKFTIEIILLDERNEAQITLIPSIGEKILEKYFFTTTERMEVMNVIKNKMIERAKAEPEIYKHFGA